MRTLLAALIAMGALAGCESPGGGSSRPEPEPAKASAQKPPDPPSTAPPSNPPSGGIPGRSWTPPAEELPDAPPPGSLEILSVESGGTIKAGEAKSARRFQLKDPEMAPLLEVGDWILPSQDGAKVKALVHFSYKADKSGPSPGIKGATKSTGPEAPGPNWSTLPNPALKGRMGRLIIEFPGEGKGKGKNTRFEVFLGEEKSEGGYGSESIELMPGAYRVEVSGRTVEGVPIAAKQDTRLHVGLLNVGLQEKGTRWDLFDAEGKKSLIGGYGPYEVGLPSGSYLVEIHKVRAPVKIEAGKVTDF